MLACSSSIAQAVPIRITIELAGTPSPKAPISGVLKVTPQSGTEPSLELPAELPGERQVDLRPGVPWNVHFEAKGFWSETSSIMVQQTPVRLRVFPAGHVQGQVALPAGEKPPKSLAVRLQFPFGPARTEPLDVTITCPVIEGKIRCETPAGKFDLRLRAEGGFAPIYLWGIGIPAGKVADLGELKLRRGASVSGWVQTAEGRPPSKDCRLKLSPARASEDDLKVRDQLEKASFEAHPNEKGFFQIVGVPPGQYELTAEQAGYAQARIRPVDVRPDLEAQVIDRLTLAKPVTVEVALDPPIEPYGHPWRIVLARKAQPSDPPSDSYSGTATREGAWRSPGISPGTYEIQVLGDRKDVWHEEMVEVQPGQPPLRIDLPVLRVKGTVTLGKEPLEATLWLSQKSGQRLVFDSDDRGRFSGVLPREGRWYPQISSDSPKLRVQLDPIEIKVAKGKTVAEVEIHIPDTHLVGQVVDETGRPVQGARVQIAKPGDKSVDSIDTDEKGEFSVRGLRPGSRLVEAVENDRRSDYTMVQVPDEGESPWLRLVIRRLRTFEGRIVSANGGVPGAMVQASAPLVDHGSASTSQSDQAISDADGRFQVELPADSAILNLLVFPPGYAMRLLTVAATAGQSIEIPVEPQGGTLILDLTAEGPSPLLVHGGTFTLPQILSAWARMQGARSRDPQRLVVPNVEAGVYSLCRGGGVVSKLREGGEPPAANCASGVLAPNGDLVLKAPVLAGTAR
jgi:uncharacterized GH25 family protein